MAALRRRAGGHLTFPAAIIDAEEEGTWYLAEVPADWPGARPGVTYARYVLRPGWAEVFVSEEQLRAWGYGE